jgi:hypothetical protein
MQSKTHDLWKWKHAIPQFSYDVTSEVILRDIADLLLGEPISVVYDDSGIFKVGKINEEKPSSKDQLYEILMDFILERIEKERVVV